LLFRSKPFTQSTKLSFGLVLATSAFLRSYDIAAQAPDAGALQQQLQREVEQSQPSQAPAPLIKKVPTPSKPSASKETLEVKKFVVSGATLVSQEQIAQTLAPFENRELSFDQIREAANAVTALYTKIGRTARAVIPPQDVVNGVIKINILEGKVGKVIIDLDKTVPSRLKSSVIQEFISANNPEGGFIDMYGLERSMALLDELPGNQASAELRAGEREETTNISVSAKDTGIFSGRVDASNYGSPSTGAAQAVASLGLNNLSGVGDQVPLDAIGSQGSICGILKYGLPVGIEGWRVSAGVSALDY